MIFEISLDNLRYNVRSLKARAFGAKLIGVVKANAYGHGATEVAKAIRGDVCAFAVANETEARELAESGITEPIIMLGGLLGGDRLPRNVVPTVTGFCDIKAAVGKCEGVAVAVNTGMNRYGCAPENAGVLVEFAESLGLAVRYVYTHIADETDVKRSDKQLSDFICATKSIKAVKSAAATCAVNLGEKYCLDAVRAGIGLYGYGAPDLKPVASAYAPIVAIRNVKRGDGVGYGDYTAERDMAIAIVAAGYADGLMRRRGDLSTAINGVKCPAIGRICMDASFFDVSGTECKIGDRAYFLGNGAEMRDLCDCYDTIPYEVLTSFDRRSRKIFV